MMAVSSFDVADRNRGLIEPWEQHSGNPIEEREARYKESAWRYQSRVIFIIVSYRFRLEERMRDIK